MLSNEHDKRCVSCVVSLSAQADGRCFFPNDERDSASGRRRQKRQYRLKYVCVHESLHRTHNKGVVYLCGRLLFGLDRFVSLIASFFCWIGLYGKGDALREEGGLASPPSSLVRVKPISPVFLHEFAGSCSTLF